MKLKKKLIDVYRKGLLEDTLPFWFKHSIDEQCGGYITALDRDGRFFNTIKKKMWKGPFHLPKVQWYCCKLLGNIVR